MLLHDAITEILTVNGEPMKCRDIAKENEERKLYFRKKDGKAPLANQIRARAKNYYRLFDIEDAKVSLKRWNS